MPIPKRELDKKKDMSIASALGLITQIGLNMVITIGMSLFLGKFLDSIFKTSPWLLIVFTILGVLAAFRNMFYMTMRK